MISDQELHLLSLFDLMWGYGPSRLFEPRHERTCLYKICKQLGLQDYMSHDMREPVYAIYANNWAFKIIWATTWENLFMQYMQTTGPSRLYEPRHERTCLCNICKQLGLQDYMSHDMREPVYAVYANNWAFKIIWATTWENLFMQYMRTTGPSRLYEPRHEKTCLCNICQQLGLQDYMSHDIKKPVYAIYANNWAFKIIWATTWENLFMQYMRTTGPSRLYEPRHERTCLCSICKQLGLQDYMSHDMREPVYAIYANNWAFKIIWATTWENLFMQYMQTTGPSRLYEPRHERTCLCNICEQLGLQDYMSHDMREPVMQYMQTAGPSRLYEPRHERTCLCNICKQLGLQDYMSHDMREPVYAIYANSWAFKIIWATTWENLFMQYMQTAGPSRLYEPWHERTCLCNICQQLGLQDYLSHDMREPVYAIYANSWAFKIIWATIWENLFMQYMPTTGPSRLYEPIYANSWAFKIIWATTWENLFMQYMQTAGPSRLYEPRHERTCLCCICQQLSLQDYMSHDMREPVYAIYANSWAFKIIWATIWENLFMQYMQTTGPLRLYEPLHERTCLCNICKQLGLQDYMSHDMREPVYAIYANNWAFKIIWATIWENLFMQYMQTTGPSRLYEPDIREPVYAIYANNWAFKIIWATTWENLFMQYMPTTGPSRLYEPRHERTCLCNICKPLGLQDYMSHDMREPVYAIYANSWAFKIIWATTWENLFMQYMPTTGPSRLYEPRYDRTCLCNICEQLGLQDYMSHDMREPVYAIYANNWAFKIIWATTWENLFMQYMPTTGPSRLYEPRHERTCLCNICEQLGLQDYMSHDMREPVYAIYANSWAFKIIWATTWENLFMQYMQTAGPSRLYEPDIREPVYAIYANNWAFKIIWATIWENLFMQYMQTAGPSRLYEPWHERTCLCNICQQLGLQDYLSHDMRESVYAIYANNRAFKIIWATIWENLFMQYMPTTGPSRLYEPRYERTCLCSICKQLSLQDYMSHDMREPVYAIYANSWAFKIIWAKTWENLFMQYMQTTGPSRLYEPRHERTCLCNICKQLGLQDYMSHDMREPVYAIYANNWAFKIIWATTWENLFMQYMQQLGLQDYMSHDMREPVYAIYANNWAFKIIWATTWENLFMQYMQTAGPSRLYEPRHGRTCLCNICKQLGLQDYMSHDMREPVYAIYANNWAFKIIWATTWENLFMQYMQTAGPSRLYEPRHEKTCLCNICKQLGLQDYMSHDMRKPVYAIYANNWAFKIIWDMTWENLFMQYMQTAGPSRLYEPQHERTCLCNICKQLGLQDYMSHDMREPVYAIYANSWAFKMIWATTWENLFMQYMPTTGPCLQDYMSHDMREPVYEIYANNWAFKIIWASTWENLFMQYMQTTGSSRLCETWHERTCLCNICKQLGLQDYMSHDMREPVYRIYANNWAFKIIWATTWENLFMQYMQTTGPSRLYEPGHGRTCLCNICKQLGLQDYMSHDMREPVYAIYANNWAFKIIWATTWENLFMQYMQTTGPSRLYEPRHEETCLCSICKQLGLQDYMSHDMREPVYAIYANNWAFKIIWATTWENLFMHCMQTTGPSRLYEPRHERTCLCSICKQLGLQDDMSHDMREPVYAIYANNWAGPSRLYEPRHERTCLCNICQQLGLQDYLSHDVREPVYAIYANSWAFKIIWAMTWENLFMQYMPTAGPSRLYEPRHERTCLCNICKQLGLQDYMSHDMREPVYAIYVNNWAFKIIWATTWENLFMQYMPTTGPSRLYEPRHERTCLCNICKQLGLQDYMSHDMREPVCAVYANNWAFKIIWATTWENLFMQYMQTAGPSRLYEPRHEETCLCSICKQLGLQDYMSHDMREPVCAVYANNWAFKIIWATTWENLFVQYMQTTGPSSLYEPRHERTCLCNICKQLGLQDYMSHDMREPVYAIYVNNWAFKNIWATTWGNLFMQYMQTTGPSRLYEPRHEKTCLCYMRTTKMQISLCNCAVWSVPLLFAAWIV